MLHALVTQIELEAVSFSMANIFSQQMSHANLKKKKFWKTLRGFINTYQYLTYDRNLTADVVKANCLRIARLLQAKIKVIETSGGHQITGNLYVLNTYGMRKNNCTL